MISSPIGVKWNFKPRASMKRYPMLFKNAKEKCWWPSIGLVTMAETFLLGKSAMEQCSVVMGLMRLTSSVGT